MYAEAKSEYTRQLCQILGPAIQIYFLDLLKVAKEKDTDARRMLWNFQALLQEIPDWNQDKVLRETEKIQKDTNCDYLEELLTAVFIAHTKVLSAIRITTKQKKLQITIPKIDHFLHRTLRETGRLLWGNAFLFAEQGPSIERQKNMRQIETLIQEGIQQSIRSLLPVKTILREYLNDEADEGEEEADKAEEDDEEETKKKEPEVAQKEAHTDEAIAEEEAVPEHVKVPEEHLAKVPEPVAAAAAVADAPAPAPTLDIPVQNPVGARSVVNIIKEEAVPVITVPAVAPAVASGETPTAPPTALPAPSPTPGPTLVVATEPSVSFTNMDTIFDSENPDANIISDSPHIEEDIDHIETLDLPPEPMDGFEDIDSTGDKIEFEEIA